MNKKEVVGASIVRVMRLVDELGQPDKMTKTQWIEFLTVLEHDLAIQREASEQELKEEGGDVA